MANDIEQNQNTFHSSVSESKFSNSKLAIDNINPQIQLTEHDSPTRDLQIQYNNSVDTYDTMDNKFSLITFAEKN